MWISDFFYISMKFVHKDSSNPSLIEILAWRISDKPLSESMMVYFTVAYIVMTSSNGWRHQMETFSALLAICGGNSPVPGEFPAQRPVTRSFDVFFHLRLNQRLSKQSWGWRFEILSRPLWRHCNVHFYSMKTSSHESLYRITGPLCGLFTGHRWIPLAKGL